MNNGNNGTDKKEEEIEDNEGGIEEMNEEGKVWVLVDCVDGVSHEVICEGKLIGVFTRYFKPKVVEKRISKREMKKITEEFKKEFHNMKLCISTSLVEVRMESTDLMNLMDSKSESVS